MTTTATPAVWLLHILEIAKVPVRLEGDTLHVGPKGSRAFDGMVHRQHDALVSLLRTRASAEGASNQRCAA